MQDHPVLGQTLIGHAPVIDRQRAVVATRLTIFPENPTSLPDARDLLAAVAEAFPPPSDGITLSLRPVDGRGGAGTAPGGAIPPVLLHIGHEGLLAQVMAVHPPPHLMLEVPAFMLADPAAARPVGELQQSGQPLAISGRPVAELPRDMLPWFRFAIVDLAEDRRGAGAGAAGQRQVPYMSSGVRTLADVERAFQQGAQAAVGWPVEGDAPAPGRRGLTPDLHAIVELMKRVDNEDPAERMEPVLKTDPTLAFRLLRYINSAAFGLRVEVTSFKHALMLLGYMRLKRWLALLLAGASKDASMRPLMHAAVRRGFLMEELARGVGDEEMRSEMFICGVFSLLDRMLRQPFAELLDNVPVPERVQASLTSADGPYAPQLELARAVEQGSPVDIRECANRLLIGPGEVSRAVLAALSSARQID